MIDWLLTFLLHSTLWLGAAALWMKFRRPAAPRIREWVWSTALLACFVTPTVQSLSGGSVALWSVPLTAPSALVEEGHEPEGGYAGEHRERSVPAPREHERAEHAELSAAPIGWTRVAVLAWLAIAAGLLLRYAVRMARLRRLLMGRRAVTDPHALSALQGIGQECGLQRVPRLTQCDALNSPVALGCGGRNEVCVPSRALAGLDDEEYRAMLGHEVAHLVRRDPVRLVVLHALQSVFFIQPLVRLAAREMRASIEEQCDDWSAGRLEDPLAMASCLTEVATWVVLPRAALPVPCMVHERSRLHARVQRLLDERFRTEAKVGGFGLAIPALFLMAAPWLAPERAAAAAPSPLRAEHAEGSGEHRHGGEHREGRERSSREHR